MMDKTSKTSKTSAPAAKPAAAVPVTKPAAAAAKTVAVPTPIKPTAAAAKPAPESLKPAPAKITPVAPTPTISRAATKSAQPPPIEREETFSLFDPNASKVELVGDFTDWQENPIRLKRQKSGAWTVTVPLAPGMHEYRFLVDGEWRDDAACSQRKPNGFGAENCLRQVSP